MNLITIITMTLILSIVWGGFIYFMIKAIKFEKQKVLSKNGEE